MDQFIDVDSWAELLDRMLVEQRPEDIHLDYKDARSLFPTARGGGGVDKQKRGEDISKDVSSLLNSDGGVLVYGVPESQDPNSTGGAPIPGGPEIGFKRGEIDKETVENLITSNIQPKLDPNLFQVTEVPYGNTDRMVIVVEVALGIGDVWQAKDKRYYKRFHYKAEAMEHYEINMVRERSLAPDLKIQFGLNEPWRKDLLDNPSLGLGAELLVGIRNSGNAVAESALVEIGYCPNSSDYLMNKLTVGPAPDNLLGEVFEQTGIRRVDFNYTSQAGTERQTISAAWGQLNWNGSNPKLAGKYSPIFKTEAPLLAARIPLSGISTERTSRAGLALVFWRLQAPGMQPRKGSVELRGREGFPSDPFLKCQGNDWETA